MVIMVVIDLNCYLYINDIFLIIYIFIKRFDPIANIQIYVKKSHKYYLNKTGYYVTINQFFLN